MRTGNDLFDKTETRYFTLCIIDKKIMKKAIYISILIILFSFSTSFGQYKQVEEVSDRILSPAVPFLRVAADARASGMGDIGVVSSADIYSQQWNAAKYAFVENKREVGVSYTPYLRKITSDVHIGQLNFYNRIDERSAFAVSARYFSLGKVVNRNTPNEEGFESKPNQLAVDLSYALKLSEHFSMGVTARYIRSDMKLQSSFDDAKAGNSFGVDISGFYEGPVVAHSSFDGRWRAGFNVSDIGPKIKYYADTEGDFLPTNLALGGGYDFIFNDKHAISAYLEFNKLLIPTPKDSNDDGIIDHNDDYYNKGAVGGIFSSFGGAPGGFSEEMKEITWALGSEYKYRDTFSFRAGYFHESKDKGYRQYITAGAGFKYDFATFNFSYLFNTAKQVTNPMEGSLRFSVAFKLN